MSTLNKAQVLDALGNADALPFVGKGKRRMKPFRMIYEVAAPKGHFYIDYATYPGGTGDEVPLAVIAELEREGLITRAFEDAPHIQAWKLNSRYSPTA